MDIIIFYVWIVKDVSWSLVVSDNLWTRLRLPEQFNCWKMVERFRW